MPLNPTEFAKQAAHSIPVDEARSILKEMGIDIPAGFSGPESATRFLETVHRLSPTKIKKFIELASEKGAMKK